MYGQAVIENYISAPGRNLSAVEHVTDADGNTFLLAADCGYYAGPGVLIEGTACNMVVYKLGPSGDVRWHRVIPGRSSASPIFVDNATVFIPYSIKGDNIKDSGRGYFPAAFDCGILLDKLTGAVLKNKCFRNKLDIDISRPVLYDDTSRLSASLAAFRHQDNTISYISALTETLPIRMDSVHSTISVVSSQLVELSRSDTLGYTSVLPGARTKYAYRTSVFFDEFTDGYFIADTTTVFLYNREWQLALKVNLPYKEQFSYDLHEYKIACNEQYFIVNYGNPMTSNNSRNFTAVYDRKGKLISAKETSHYEVLSIDDNNVIYAVPEVNRQMWGDTAARPVTLINMNIRQQVIREQHLGKPYVRAKSVSLTRKNQLILTGTCRTSWLEVSRCPDVVYFYKEQPGK